MPLMAHCTTTSYFVNVSVSSAIFFLYPSPCVPNFSFSCLFSSDRLSSKNCRSAKSVLSATCSAMKSSKAFWLKSTSLFSTLTVVSFLPKKEAVPPVLAGTGSTWTGTALAAPVFVTSLGGAAAAVGSGCGPFSSPGALGLKKSLRYCCLRSWASLRWAFNSSFSFSISAFVIAGLSLNCFVWKSLYFSMSMAYSFFCSSRSFFSFSISAEALSWFFLSWLTTGGGAPLAASCSLAALSSALRSSSWLSFSSSSLRSCAISFCDCRSCDSSTFTLASATEAVIPVEGVAAVPPTAPAALAAA
eukprot:Colp12_sorted_trinity150504_noHs@31271